MTDRAEDQAQRDKTSTLTRVIIGGDGRTWLVRESSPSPYDRRGAPTLVFLTDDVMRRVQDYPADWFELADPDLFALSMRR